MRYRISINCLLVAFFAAASTSVAQYEPMPPASGGYFPYNDGPPWHDDSMPAEYQIGNAPGDLGSDPRYAQAPRNSSFQPESRASYAPENAGPYNRPRQDFERPANTPWGPPPDVYSIVPEGTRRSPQRPRAEPAPPLNANPASDFAPPAAAEPPQNELFEPVPGDLEDDFIWYQPSTWEDFGWDATVELGLNGSTGNSRTNALKAGFKAERETEIYKFLFEIVHNRAATQDISTQNNLISKLRGDRKLGESRWSLFAQGYSEYDEFKDFDLRLAGTMGFTYQFIKSDTTTLSSELGSGVSHEIGGPDDSYVPEGMLGLDFKHKLSKRQQLYVKSQYFPDWSNFNSYRVVTDAGWELLLDEEWGLNLKIGVLDRYDSTPGSRRPNDFNYSMLLLWKL